MEERRVSPSKAARRLGVTLGFVYSMIWSGQLLATKRDRRWWIEEESVARRLKMRERTLSQEGPFIGRTTKKGDRKNARANAA
jgi:hypothetical protein